MEYKYKWYIIKVDYGYEKDICELATNTVYFKEVFIPYQTVCDVKSDIKELCEVYICMHLCDESKNILNQMTGFCGDESGHFEMISDDEVYGFLKNGNVPKVIEDNEIRSMCSALYNAQETKKLSYGYEKGEKVKINDGLFQNFTGKPTIIELDLAQVEKIED
nr:unnamed protein product [Callosobruchus chinensis]CAH7717248.1 unnamed protein product [Callosobruchus chinensis]